VKILQEARNVQNIARQDEPLPPSSQLILVSQELKGYLDVEARVATTFNWSAFVFCIVIPLFRHKICYSSKLV
jgi:hypothetical protein